MEISHSFWSSSGLPKYTEMPAELTSSCLVYFFAALAGIGYVDPDTLPSVPGSAPILANAPAPAVFIPGVPIFDPNEDSEVARRRKHEERKELEKEWQKMKRPKDVSSH